MTAFNHAVEAKEFFISRIIAEAVRENAALSDLEKRTLYFTETGSDAKQEYLDDVAKFEDQYDDQEYEQKIARLLKKAYDYDSAHPEELGVEDAGQTYRSAYEVLRREDHYILIMIDQALGWKLRKKLFGIF